jgi:hypothetical protein
VYPMRRDSSRLDTGTDGGRSFRRHAGRLDTLQEWSSSRGLLSRRLFGDPLLGFPLGVAALILGLRGLRRAKEHPEARGKAHAWVGIIAGGFFGLLYLILTVFLIYAGMKG